MGCLEYLCSKKKSKEPKINVNQIQINKKEENENDANSYSSLNRKDIRFQHNNFDDNKYNQDQPISRNEIKKTNTEIFQKKNNKIQLQSLKENNYDKDTVLKVKSKSKENKNNKNNKDILIMKSNSEIEEGKNKENKISKKKEKKNLEEILKKIKEEINLKKNDLEKINKEYQEKEDKLNKMNKYIDKNTEEINKINEKKKEIKIINEELKLINEELKFKKDEIQKFDKELEFKKEELINRKKELIKYDERLEKNKKELINQNNLLKTLEDKIEKNKEELVSQKNLLKSFEEKIEKNKEELKMKENLLISFEEKLEKRKEELKINQNLIQAKKIELINKENNLNKREKDLFERERELNIRKEPILIGLNNIGATCYMNASLQCLSNTKKLTQYFLKTYKYNSNKIMSNEYYKVIKNLWKRENNNKSYSPNSFKEVLSKENPLFAGIAANDSKDLINFLLERFHRELNAINNENIIDDNSMINMQDQTNEQLMLKYFLTDFQEKFNSPISNLIYDILETKSQCQGCNILKYNFQVYSFIEFPLQQVNTYFFNKGKRPLFTMDGKNPDIDLYECFEYNQKVDLMAGDNQMYCNNCNKLCNSFYSTSLYSGPYYLIINLNRGRGAVYECKVSFPEQLNIINFITYKEGVTVYELYAVICHLGPSSMSGHFVAYCRNIIDNKWYLYNDAFVTLCDKNNQYYDGMPYILFYKALMPGQDSEY